MYYRFSGFGIYKQMLSFFEELLSFSKLQLNFKKKDVSNTTFH